MERYLFVVVVVIVVIGGWVYFYGGLDDAHDNDIIIPEGAVASFEEVSGEVGLEYVQSVRSVNNDLDYLKESMPELFSGGAAVGDYDDDGFIDIYVTVLDGKDELFRNVEGEFVDVSEEMGLNLDVKSNKAEFGDIDNDGDLDLVVSTIDDRYYLFVQDNGGFVEEGVARGLGTEIHKGFSVDFFDYDNDGWLDIKTNDWNGYGGGKDSGYGGLFRNDRGKFVEVSDEVGVKMITSQEFGDLSFDSEFGDFDNDGLMDLIVAADFGNSKLYWNSGNNRFVDGTVDSGVGLDEFGMGVSVGDYDNDSLEDFFVSSIYCEGEDCFEGMSGNKLYRNNGDRRFSEVAVEVGVEDGGWGWEAEFFDYDLDKDLDLIMARGMKDKIMGEHDFTSYAVVLWENDDGMFRDVTEEMGLGIIGEGRDVVILDYDNDKDLDVFVVRNGEGGLLFRNGLIG